LDGTGGNLSFKKMSAVKTVNVRKKLKGAVMEMVKRSSGVRPESQ
jgi:hypothetical protein